MPTYGRVEATVSKGLPRFLRTNAILHLEDWHPGPDVRGYKEWQELLIYTRFLLCTSAPAALIVMSVDQKMSKHYTPS